MNTVSLTIDMNDRDSLIKASSILENMALNMDSKKSIPDANHIPLDHNAGVEPVLADKSAVAPVVLEGSGVDNSHLAGKIDPIPNQGVELDAEGLPWDARIHSSSKKKTAKEKTWKIARNKDKALVAQVKQELKDAMDAGNPGAEFNEMVDQEMKASGNGDITPEAIAPVPPVVAAPAPAPAPEPEVEMETVYLYEGEEYSLEQLSAWTQEQIDTLAEKIERPVATEPEPAADMTFAEFLPIVTKAINEGQFAQVDVDLACQRLDLSNSALLAARPDLIPKVMTALGLS